MDRRADLQKTTSTVWRSSHIPSKSRQQRGNPIQLPTLDQRDRVLDLFITLSPRHMKECTRGAVDHCIERLAEARNSAFVPLYKLRDVEGYYFYGHSCERIPASTICSTSFGRANKKNDGNYICHDKIQEAVIYNNWTAYDINGIALEHAPFKRIFHCTASAQRWQPFPIQLQSFGMASRYSILRRSALCCRSGSAWCTSRRANSPRPSTVTGDSAFAVPLFSFWWSLTSLQKVFDIGHRGGRTSPRSAVGGLLDDPHTTVCGLVSTTACSRRRANHWASSASRCMVSFSVLSFT